jgi:hypothetical protein
MRWWFQTTPPYLMSVDNATVRGMDYSELLEDEPDLWMVEWKEGRGELERMDVENFDNLNGLRENFVDIIPYCPFFDQFLTLLKLKALTLTQAKKVKGELIGEVFNAKRQAPYHHPVAAGDYWWDATDATLFASTVPALQNSIAKVNEIIGKLNTNMPGLNNADASIVSQVNSGAIAPGDALTAQININIRDQGNAIKVELTSVMQNVIAVLVNEINGSLVNYINSNVTSLNGAVMSGSITEEGGTSTTVAKPGLAAGLLSSPALSTAAGAPSSSFLSATADFVSVSAPSNPWSAVANVVQSNTSWIPIGGTAPVSVTPAEASAIMQGIAARTNDLNIRKNTKLGQLNALTTVDDVIAYDVTTGW